jgi:hypothetical protein
MIFFVVGIEAKTEVYAKNWTSRMNFTFYLFVCQKKCHSLSFFLSFHMPKNINDGLVHIGPNPKYCSLSHGHKQSPSM